MEYYKAVFRLANGVRVSAGALPEGLRLQYRKDMETRSQIKSGKLFVFDNSGVAKRFLSTRWYKGENHKRRAVGEVWRVEVTNPTQCKRYIPCVWRRDLWDDFSRKNWKILSSFWDEKKIDYHFTGEGEDWSYIVDSVKLIEKVA